MTKTNQNLRAIHMKACAAALKNNRSLTPDVDAFWPAYLTVPGAAVGEKL